MLPKTIKKSLLASAVLGSMVAMPAAAQDLDWGFGGYVKLDTFVSDYADGPAPASGNIGRQFYIPSVTPVGGQGDDLVTDFHARQSRFFFTAGQELENGKKITGRIELDFLTVPVGDERITNSYAPRIRQAFLTYDGWTFGQAWSNFQDLTILPESVDFVGATDGMAFMRQTQIKYDAGNGFSASIENPETTVTPNGGGARITSSDGFVPDFTAKYVHKSDGFHFAVAGLLRQLAYDVSGAQDDETATGYGINVSTKYMLGKNDVRFSVVHGSGIGRYVGLNTFNDAVIDGNGELETIDVTGFTFAYRHVLSETTRMNFVATRGWTDNDVALIGTSGTEYTQRLAVNMMYSPTPKLTFGVELSQATRETEAGIDGDLNRLHFMAMYSF